MSPNVSLTPELLQRAYTRGIFPMGDEETGAIHWFSPDPRGVLPLDDFQVTDTLGRRVRRQEFAVTSDRAFEKVIRGCADRERTWITPRVRDAYTEMHERGFAHSVEAWKDGALAGGLYGVALGGAFFGESMFFQVSNASKVALVHLVRQMRAGGFALLDTQYSTSHLEQFGVTEIPRSEYMHRLDRALDLDAAWWPLDEDQAADLSRPVEELRPPSEPSRSSAA